MKHSFLITFVLLSIAISLSCNLKREVKVLGFAHKGETITLKEGADTIFNYKVEAQEDANSICSFFKQTNIYFKTDYIALKVILDSNNVTKLDATVIFSRQNKRPFISLEDPNKIKGNKRSLFIGEASN